MGDTEEGKGARLRIRWPGLDTLLWARFTGPHRGMDRTDLASSDLEILVAVIDDGVFWAAAPDEADALGQNRTMEDYRTQHIRP